MKSEIEVKSEDNKSSKSEVFMACLGTGIGINMLIIILLELFASEHFFVVYMDNYIPVALMFLIFIILWPIYSKKMKKSSFWSKYFPFN